VNSLFSKIKLENSLNYWGVFKIKNSPKKIYFDKLLNMPRRGILNSSSGAT
jgi:hypothetical protein